MHAPAASGDAVNVESPHAVRHCAGGQGRAASSAQGRPARRVGSRRYIRPEGRPLTDSGMAGRVLGLRGVEQRQLVGLITRRSEVRILPPQPTRFP